MARALLSEADISSSPVVAGMRLGGRSPDARTGCCGIHVRDGVKGVGAEGRTAFSPLGTMVDLSQWLYQTTCHSAADKSSIRQSTVDGGASIESFSVKSASAEGCCFPGINKQLLPRRFPCDWPANRRLSVADADGNLHMPIVNSSNDVARV